jgi:hypothetical protein
MGNASNLRQNPTWATILDEMEDREQIDANGFQIRCSRHPDEMKTISKPGQLAIVAPEGGCLRQCEYRMACGHNCKSVVSASSWNADAGDVTMRSATWT